MCIVSPCAKTLSTRAALTHSAQDIGRESSSANEKRRAGNLKWSLNCIFLNAISPYPSCAVFPKRNWKTVLFSLHSQLWWVNIFASEKKLYIVFYVVLQHLLNKTNSNRISFNAIWCVFLCVQCGRSSHDFPWLGKREISSAVRLREDCHAFAPQKLHSLSHHVHHVMIIYCQVNCKCIQHCAHTARCPSSEASLCMASQCAVSFNLHAKNIYLNIAYFACLLH